MKKLFSKHFIILTLAGNFIVFLFAIAIYYLEQGTNPQIDEFMDALWWAFSTVTTVGDGAIVPITFWGRILGICLMLFGTALFATFVSIFAEYFLGLNLDGINHFKREQQSQKIKKIQEGNK